MAAASPALSSTSTDSGATTSTAPVSAAAAPSIGSIAYRSDGPPKTLRGLNKPKCIQCGNVARSRCPYQSCKSCCSKAQNPCHIHVLKANATFPDKAPTSSTPLFNQQSTEASPSGTSLRVASLRQLSNNFAQFNNVHIPFRSRKPLTRKDAAVINEWRFSKLKEYKDRNIEVENEAFDRYMQNIGLLEEVFLTKSLMEGTIEDGSATSAEVDSQIMSSGLISRSHPMRIENFRKRIQFIVDKGLKRLQKCELADDINDLDDLDETNKRPKRAKSYKAERASALGDLIDKLNKAQNAEDLKSCLEAKSQHFNQNASSSPMEIENSKLFKGQAIDVSASRNDLNHSKQKLYTTSEIDQETLNSIDAHFSSLEQIEDL